MRVRHNKQKKKKLSLLRIWTYMHIEQNVWMDVCMYVCMYVRTYVCLRTTWVFTIETKAEVTHVRIPLSPPRETKSLIALFSWWSKRSMSVKGSAGLSLVSRTTRSVWTWLTVNPMDSWQCWMMSAACHKGRMRSMHRGTYVLYIHIYIYQQGREHMQNLLYIYLSIWERMYENATPRNFVFGNLLALSLFR